MFNPALPHKMNEVTRREWTNS